MTQSVPTLFDWAGGEPALARLFERFYQRVPDDALLAPVFAHMDPAHARHVAAFVGEVLGGPASYSAQHGGHPAMIRKHLARSLSQAQRKRWVELLLECADEVGLPDDPEFRSAFVAYLEWGSRLAVINSQPGAQAIEDAPMPRWGWGEVKGPYQPPP
ncbi:MAG TPA: group II truncated hemoglobin [Polyangiales bacterium]